MSHCYSYNNVHISSMKLCDDCEIYVAEDSIICPCCLNSISDKQLPLDQLIEKQDTRAKQKLYEFRSHNYQKNRHKI